MLSLVNTIENGAIKVDSKTGEVIEETINKQPVFETVIVYDDLPFDENDMQAITDTIAMFKGN